MEENKLVQELVKVSSHDLMKDLYKIHRIFVNFSFLWHRVSFFLFSTIKIINAIYEKTQKKRIFIKEVCPIGN